VHGERAGDVVLAGALGRDLRALEGDLGELLDVEEVRERRCLSRFAWFVSMLVVLITKSTLAVSGFLGSPSIVPDTSLKRPLTLDTPMWRTEKPTSEWALSTL
jgi:hypothetical protein